jgi:glycerol-3-phosphate acyltransferase PlsY
MIILLSLLVLILSYILGSIPFGLVIVRLTTGQDIRHIESGRTGGTNVARAAGFWAGAATAVLDFMKSACTVWIVRVMQVKSLLPQTHWLEVLAPVMVVVGHNYSIFLAECKENGLPRLRGGAGGASTVGGAFGLWPYSLLIIFPIGLIILFGVGYASVATVSVALVAALVFACRTWIGVSPWQYIFYGVLTEILLIWALRPNIQRLLNGTERAVGWRARRRNHQTDISRAGVQDHSSSSSKYSSSS